jgi:hypothetical protein
VVCEDAIEIGDRSFQGRSVKNVDTARSFSPFLASAQGQGSRRSVAREDRECSALLCRWSRIVAAARESAPYASAAVPSTGIRLRGSLPIAADTPMNRLSCHRLSPVLPPESGCGLRSRSRRPETICVAPAVS